MRPASRRDQQCGGGDQQDREEPQQLVRDEEPVGQAVRARFHGAVLQSRCSLARRVPSTSGVPQRSTRSGDEHGSGRSERSDGTGRAWRGKQAGTGPSRVRYPGAALRLNRRTQQPNGTSNPRPAAETMRPVRTLLGSKPKLTAWRPAATRAFHPGWRLAATRNASTTRREMLPAPGRARGSQFKSRRRGGIAAWPETSRGIDASSRSPHRRR